jgi:diketogulonate reductase-like aldo/keto reductase
MAIVAYSPFGQGDFPSPRSTGGRLLADIATRHGRTSRQVALNFLTRRPHIFAIPKATNPDHVLENSGGVGWDLSAQDVTAIDRAFRI